MHEHVSHVRAVVGGGVGGQCGQQEQTLAMNKRSQITDSDP